MTNYNKIDHYSPQNIFFLSFFVVYIILSFIISITDIGNARISILISNFACSIIPTIETNALINKNINAVRLIISLTWISIPFFVIILFLLCIFNTRDQNMIKSKMIKGSLTFLFAFIIFYYGFAYGIVIDDSRGRVQILYHLMILHPFFSTSYGLVIYGCVAIPLFLFVLCTYNIIKYNYLQRKTQVNEHF